MSLDATTLERLYGPPQDGWLPYRLFAWAGETYSMKVMHFPGVEANPIPIERAYEAPYHGYRGLLVQDYARSLNDQRVVLCWCAVDIDGKDNPGLSFDELHRRTAEAIDDMGLGGSTVLRSSKSGAGIHVIHRNHTWSMKDRTYTEAQDMAKHGAARIVRDLMHNGVMTCVYGLPNLWLWSEGGKQRNLN